MESLNGFEHMYRRTQGEVGGEFGLVYLVTFLAAEKLLQS